MNTNQKHRPRLLWMGGVVLALMAGTAMAGDHHGRSVRGGGSFGFYVGGAAYPVYSTYPVYPVYQTYPVCPPVVVYSYSQPYYAPPVIFRSSWGYPRTYYAAPRGHDGYRGHRR